jgi:hypothetical protein
LEKITPFRNSNSLGQDAFAPSFNVRGGEVKMINRVTEAYLLLIRENTLKIDVCEAEIDCVYLPEGERMRTRGEEEV